MSDYELRHHGVQGQKWGVQNGPPYPLDSSVSTGSKLKQVKDRVKRAKKGAKYEQKIDRLSNKEPNEKRVQKIKSFVEQRNQLVGDLTDDEIELGRRYLERSQAITTSAAIGLIFFGAPGAAVTAAGTYALNQFNDFGRDTKALASKVRNDYMNKSE